MDDSKLVLLMRLRDIVSKWEDRSYHVRYSDPRLVNSQDVFGSTMRDFIDMAINGTTKDKPAIDRLQIAEVINHAIKQHAFELGFYKDLKNQRFVMTGIRDARLDRMIAELGGAVTSAVSSKTTYVIAKDPNKRSEKIFAGRKWGAFIVSYSEVFKCVQKMYDDLTPVF